jgi:ATP-dependent Lon protease
MYKIILSYLNNIILQKKLKNLLAKMTTHVNNCPLERNLKYIKLEKIVKIVKYLNCINKFPIKVQSIGLLWIKCCWQKLVLDNGFNNINDTLLHLNININYGQVLSDIHLQSFFTVNDFCNYYSYSIIPLNCQINIKNNKSNYIRLSDVKPSLPQLEGKLYGICTEIDQPNFTIRIFGLIDADILRIYRNYIPKHNIIKELYTKYTITKDEALPYLNCFSYRDYLVSETRQIVTKIKQLKEKIEYSSKTDESILLSEYQFLPEYMRIELISVFLELGLKNKANYLYSRIPIPIHLLDWKLQKDIDYSMSSFTAKKNKDIPEQVPYEIRISGMKTTEKIKAKAYEKLKLISQSTDSAPKAQKYLDGILKIPFESIKSEPDLDDPGKDLVEELYKKFPKYHKLECFTKFGNNYMKILNQATFYEKSKNLALNGKKKLEIAREKQQQYLTKVEEILEKCVHGHKLVKTQIRRLLAQWISGGQSGIVLGLEGPPGNGKTTLIKQGLAKCLVDGFGNSRPVGFIPLGGTSSSSYLSGHSYTYQGSTWGRIVDILMECQCMNPILLFDELDKISNTESGREITGILTHLTDSTQNEEYYDKYFEGIPLDLSKALMIFTFNDRSKIDPILLDRMTVIETLPLSIEDKKVISINHLIPQITNLVDLEPNEINISNYHIDKLINDYTREAGARQLKKLFESLIQELNLRRLLNPDTEMIIDDNLINDVFKHKDKIRRESISNIPFIGQINGMYANALGLGGILPIQVSENSSDNKLELTGTQGDIMKESMKCAKTMAFKLVTSYNSNKVIDTNKGLHIHCPSTSVPKDGPSAGGAICLAIFSFLSNIPIKQNIAMTGEIDLIGRITAIGGLEAKLLGAKKAGVNIALIPEENLPQLKRLREENKSSEDDRFKVILINHIENAIKYVI